MAQTLPMVASTEGLDKLLSLQHLDVSHNVIEDLAEIKRVTRLPCLDHLNTEGGALVVAAAVCSTCVVSFQWMWESKEMRLCF